MCFFPHVFCHSTGKSVLGGRIWGPAPQGFARGKKAAGTVTSKGYWQNYHGEPPLYGWVYEAPTADDQTQSLQAGVRDALANFPDAAEIWPRVIVYWDVQVQGEVVVDLNFKPCGAAWVAENRRSRLRIQRARDAGEDASQKASLPPVLLARQAAK